MDVVITGSSGLIGTALRRALVTAGHRPRRLVRRRAEATDEISWDPARGVLDPADLEGVDAIVNLAGPGIGDRRWNDDYKRTLRDARVDGTRLLAETMASMDQPPARFLSGAAIGFYGDRGDEILTETSRQGQGFLPDLVAAWEAATAPAVDAGISTATLRTGIVLTPEGGALAKMLPLFRIGAGGRFGPGTQYMAWISLADEVAAIIHLLTSDLTGPVNLTGPEPVTNAEFTHTLGQVLGRPTVLTVPSFGPKLLLGSEMARALLFDSQRVIPQALTDDGFRFATPDLTAALRFELDRPDAPSSAPAPPSERRSLSVSRVVAAPAGTIFDVLADPSLHQVIDGSGTVRGGRGRNPDRLFRGARFGMDMRMKVPYRITNEVVEFEEGRLIAWRHLGHHVWRYQLEPVEGGTRVTETFDWGTARFPPFYEWLKLPERTRAAMTETLDRLDRYVTTGDATG
ncbi:MAG: TIGR01777 family oxidoreductase [Acidimicrobiales bacterium]